MRREPVEGAPHRAVYEVDRPDWVAILTTICDRLTVGVLAALICAVILTRGWM